MICNRLLTQQSPRWIPSPDQFLAGIRPGQAQLSIYKYWWPADIGTCILATNKTTAYYIIFPFGIMPSLWNQSQLPVCGSRYARRKTMSQHNGSSTEGQAEHELVLARGEETVNGREMETTIKLRNHRWFIILQCVWKRIKLCIYQVTVRCKLIQCLS